MSYVKVRAKTATECADKQIRHLIHLSPPTVDPSTLTAYSLKCLIRTTGRFRGTHGQI